MHTAPDWRISTTLRGRSAACFASYSALWRRTSDAVAAVRPAWLASRHDDIVQAAMMRLMRAVRRGSRQGFGRAYVRRAAYTAMLDEIRRVRACPESPWVTAQHDARGRGGPELAARVAETGAAVAAILAELTEGRRAAVRAYLEGNGIGAIAERYDWSYKRAENLTRRGLADLRRRLTELGLGPT